MNELDEVKAELARLERLPVPEDLAGRTRINMKVQGCHRRIIQLSRVIELEQSK